MSKTFKAYRLTQSELGEVTGEVSQLKMTDLPEGEVLIKVHYSSINYKDAMANMSKSPIVKQYPFTPGIDLAGEVVESIDDRFVAGDPVIVTSYELGVSHDGGYSEYQRVKAEWVVPLPEGLSLKDAMLYGTAGLTAALSVSQLEKQGMDKSLPILVTGATGGVGSIATAILSNLGYNVEAVTGKSDMHEWLKSLGAKTVIDRHSLTDGKAKAIDSPRYGGAVDVVGGELLARVLTQLSNDSTVAVSGLTGGVNVPTTVYPFILRAIKLVGIDSVYCPIERRKEMWSLLGSRYQLDNNQKQHIEHKEITLDQLAETLPILLEGGAKGRYLLKLN